jgi:GDP-mannose 6-dehydrogenase
MKTSIFGLGYVGAVTAGCLTDVGDLVIGVDVQQEKVDAFNAGQSPIIEPGLSDLLEAATRKGRLRATLDAAGAVRDSDVSIVCVGTPSLPSGRMNLAFIQKVSEQISEALRASSKKHVVIFRSTMLPGSTRGLAGTFFDDLRATGQVRIYYCPEFLREGTGVMDFREPSLAVIGTHDGLAPESNEVSQLLPGAHAVFGWEGAEMIKYSCNYFHALKAGFANEIGRMCKFLGEDGARVMQMICADTRLNISSYYMRPGNPFGGSCLPKDVNALKAFARQEGISMPLLENTLTSNQAHLEQLLALIENKGQHRIGLLGLAFKAGTDDLRGSPMVAVAETLLGRGYELHVYDPQLNLARLIGANASEIQRRMPHLASMLRLTPGEVVDRSDIVVAAQICAPLSAISSAVRASQCVIDVNGWQELETLPWQYEGLCW